MKIESDRDFGTRECPSCAVEVAANQNRCPICGYDFPQPGPFRKNALVWVGVVVLIAVILAFSGVF